VDAPTISAWGGVVTAVGGLTLAFLKWRQRRNGNGWAPLIREMREEIRELRVAHKDCQERVAALEAERR
jgi:hypothetical protein